VAKEEPVEVGGVGVGLGVGLGVGVGVGCGGFAASVIRTNPANTKVVVNNNLTGLAIGFIA
jgi:hypothetical protein